MPDITDREQIFRFIDALNAIERLSNPDKPGKLPDIEDVIKAHEFLKSWNLDMNKTSYTVEFTEKALGDMDDIPDGDFRRIHKACKMLEENPIPDGKHIKKLKGYHDLYRLRIGDYRAVFECKGSNITVVRVLSKPDFEKKY